MAHFTVCFIADYRLHDDDDTSKYKSNQLFTSGAMNPCVTTMYPFIEKVIRTLRSYHTIAGQELKIVHLAGQSLADNVWTNSPVCNRRLTLLETGRFSRYNLSIPSRNYRL